MGVLKAHQGQGLGRQLMAAAQKAMLSAGAIIICRSRFVAPGHYNL